MGIWNIFARMTLDTAKFEAGAKRIESLSEGLGKKLANYFTIGAVAGFSRQVLKAAGDIKDLSEQLEISTDQVQELMMAAKNTGVEFEKFTAAIYKIRKAQADFRAGDKGAISLFGRLGIDPEQNALDILKQIRGVRDLSAAFDLVGVKSVALVNAVSEIKKLGPMELITSDQLEKLDQADKVIEKFMYYGKVALGKALESDMRTIQDLSRLPEHFLRTAANRVPGLTSMLGSMGIGGANNQYPATGGAKRMAEESIMAGLDYENQRKREKEAELEKKRREAMEGLSDPLNLSFQSSSANSRSSIGGFFIGTDQTARLDIERQQLQAQKMMADRIDRIEKQVAKITEGA